MLFLLDGPTVTGRRTAAVTALGMMTLSPAPAQEILVIGTGTQAANHIEALATLFPRAKLLAKGRSDLATQSFVERHKPIAPNLSALAGSIPDSVDVVITATTSKTPVYEQPGRLGRLIIGVGAFTSDAAELGKQTVDSSVVVVDDPLGARHEAGDLIQAGVDWNRVHSLASAIEGNVATGAAVLFKSVGCAAWDLAACRVVRDALS
jgi:1-piperideine-2-carboxylate/1-pyrroline-2-carboxylate reductase [NAD(P)H]